ncbi:DUF2599 domain-containing protein [Streptomyces sp. SID10853]|uniref:DUF2599 domain-containing protein n=1 Tax=Streptomyces sp. SID10853 TaxID=2706028 RepID=UPI0013BEC404|nr:DUF2599 domain-containing protein [Streptomyces sp. SID10853]
MKTLRRLALFATVCLAAPFLTSSPAAAADRDFCGKTVSGVILDKYIAMGDVSSPLKCPVTDEMTTPDGRGRYTHFQGGSVYWSAATGAHPVWGAVRDKWQAMGWETSALGYPKSDELKNADGKGVRQEFEGGTVYWSAPTGAHPVWGKIGATWGEYGWESSAFGYPASDERDGTGSWTDVDNGQVHTYRQVTQKFASGATLFWIPGGATEGCDGECTGYEVEAPGSLVKQVRVNLPTDSDKFVLMVFPTDAGFRGGIDKAVDGWQEVWTNTPNPLRLDTADEAESLREQYACHAAYASQESDGSWNTGNSWDLESDRPSVSWTYATDALFVAVHKCNWT